ncbi:MAG: Gfo/Idh/MocA family oxidoreductase [Planctomycetaceae bacterium]|jgi:predicted dehydrogenase|nr:Gfo/Idh/MocA family oxidoreductase [Planctomycetaceae bacterium]
MTINRRRFLQATLASSLTAPAVFGAAKNKKYRLAIVGSGWWGRNILNAALASQTVEPAAVVDVDQQQRDAAVKICKEKTGIDVKTFGDYREMLEQIKPEIVINAAPDHWHALITIAACQSGAHVYVEKPICHTINEGIAMVKAARETKRKVQVGTHRRVSPHCLSAMEFLRSGKLGKIGHVRSFVHYQGGGGGQPAADSPVPDGLDWDMYCGPAQLTAYNRQIHPLGFRQFLNFANGYTADWGTHWFDLILLWSQEEQYPKSAASTGGRFLYRDNTTAPDTQSVIYQFDKFDVHWETRRWGGNAAERHQFGCYFYGTKGTLHLGWQDGWTFYRSADTNGQAAEHQNAQVDEPGGQNIAAHWLDFIDAIEKDRLPVSDIETGHRATTMALLGMLSLKLGRGVVWDGVQQTIPNDPQACRLLQRDYRNPWRYPV